MAVENKFNAMTLIAEEGLGGLTAGTGNIYKAVTVAGRVAARGETAVGLLTQVGSNGDNITVGYNGKMKYVAGGTVNSGDALTVTTSGYLIAAGSGDAVVGRQLRSQVTSGSVGTGLFSFEKLVMFDVSSGHKSLHEQITFTAQATLNAALSVGKAIFTSSGDFGAGSPQTNGVLMTGTVSGGTCTARVTGVCSVRAGNVITNGRSLKVTSGWFVHADSGDVTVARALGASAAGNSGNNFPAQLGFQTPHYITSCLDCMYGI